MLSAIPRSVWASSPIAALRADSCSVVTWGCLLTLDRLLAIGDFPDARACRIDPHLHVAIAHLTPGDDLAVVGPVLQYRVIRQPAPAPPQEPERVVVPDVGTEALVRLTVTHPPVERLANPPRDLGLGDNHQQVDVDEP